MRSEVGHLHLYDIIMDMSEYRPAVCQLLKIRVDIVNNEIIETERKMLLVVHKQFFRYFHVMFVF